MKSTIQNQHAFAKIVGPEIQRSQFDRSHGHKTTFDSGYLVPIFCDEALPGDTFTLNMSTYARLGTLLEPIMDNMFLDSFFFAVPIRLIWDNWQKFNGEQTDPGDSTDFLVPEMSTGAGGVLNMSLSDFIGIPKGAANLDHSALWHRAYNLIWNEWFRDENLQPSLTVDKSDGPDVTVYALQRRGKRHDYFSSCLPWPQKGDAVTIPLGTSAPVVTSGAGIPRFDVGGVTSTALETRAGQGFQVDWNVDPGGVGEASWETTALEADLSLATAATINTLRQAFQIQRLLERDARGGTRYTEIVRSHFGVVSPDQRLQRPEFLGGGSQLVNVNVVAQTSQTDTTPQAKLAAFGVSAGSGHSFQKSFVEHCVVIGMVSVRADLTYQRSLNRMFSRRTRYDFFWPALAHIGEQAVLNKEIYARGAAFDPQDDAVFGYQERWAEYRYKPSLITGMLTSHVTGSIDIWHLAQDFGALPVLGAAFIEDDPPVDRVVAVPSEPHWIFDSYFQFKCARPLPTFSTPGLIDHF